MRFMILLLLIMMFGTANAYNVTLDYNTPDTDITYNFTIISPYPLLNGTPEIVDYNITVDNNEVSFYNDTSNSTISFYSHEHMISGTHNVLIYYTFATNIMPGTYNYTLDIYGEQKQYKGTSSSRSSRSSYINTKTIHINYIQKEVPIKDEEPIKEEEPI